MSSNIPSTPVSIPENNPDGIDVNPEQPPNVLANIYAAPDVILENKLAGIALLPVNPVHSPNVPPNIVYAPVVIPENNPDGIEVNPVQ